MAPRYDSKALTTGYDSSDNDNFEEWTTSKRKVNHKTRQVETRVSRQLLVEDGKVIADSGPQVTTRIKEDNKVEECEKEKAPKNKSKFDALDNAIEVGAETSSGRVLGEKKEIQRVSREVREENMQYHDERFKELTGHDVHRRALQAPHELITITDKEHHSANSMPRGKMVHYSNKGKKYQDTDEILEIAKLAIDGSLTKEVKRTRHHEEQSEDEQPDETGEGEELRQAGPKVERSSRRHVDYVNDFNDLETPSESSNDEYEGDSRAIMAHRTSSRNKHSSSAASGAGRHHSYQQQQHHHHHSNSSNQNQHRQHREQEEAFPRYEINPLLNSLNAETNDNYSRVNKTSSSHGRQIKPTLKDSSSESSDNEQERRRQHSKTSGVRRVESPSATSGRIKSNRSSPTSIGRDSAASGKYKSGGVESKQYHEHQQRRHLIKSPTSERARERSFSPVSKSNYSVKSSKSHREDASVQANLTDERGFNKRR